MKNEILRISALIGLEKGALSELGAVISPHVPAYDLAGKEIDISTNIIVMVVHEKR